MVCGSDSIGWSSPRNQSLLPNAVTRRGAVSPATRAIPRSPPVTNALLADGTTTRRMVRYRGMPKARDDSLTAMGVAAFVCVVIAIIPLGSILLEASIRGLRSLSPALLTSTTGGGGIGNAIQG